ncbi:MFS transporter [Actinomadura sp. 9N407]|uniref:MFS transporter n=1 Tax=Actinomadura sp. 9N407 TaxID=3375154 RepID=UPI0037B2DC00
MAERQTGRHRRPPESQATYREVFAVGEFRALWLAQALSFIGDQLAQVALAVLVYEATNSALLTALTYALTYIPPIVGGPVLSGLADLFPRRRVMVICDVIRAGLMAVMAVQGMPFWVLCALVFLTVLLGAPFSAARAAVLPDVLTGDRYVAGSAINNITHQAAQMLGFLAGGAIVAMVGTGEALALNSATFAVSALVLVAGLRRRPAPKRRERESLGLWKGTVDGGRLVFGDPTLRALVSFAWLCGFYVVPEGLAAPYAATFDGGAVTVGLLMSAMPTGMVIGAFVFSRCVRPTNRIRSMGWMSMLACAPLLGAALHPPLWAVVALWALSGAGSAYQLAANAAFVAAVPAAGRGQAFGLAQSGILAGQGLGILIAGAAAQLLGPETVVAFAGALGLSLAAILTLSWNRACGGVIAAMYARSEAAHSATQAVRPVPVPSEPAGPGGLGGADESSEPTVAETDGRTGVNGDPQVVDAHLDADIEVPWPARGGGHATHGRHGGRDDGGSERPPRGARRSAPAP